MVLRPQRQRRATAVAAAAAEERDAAAASLAPSSVTGSSAAFKTPMSFPTAFPNHRAMECNAGKSIVDITVKPRCVAVTSGSSSNGGAGRIKVPPEPFVREDGIGTQSHTSSSSTSPASLVSSSSTSKKSQTPEFLVKLHRILLNEDKDIIYWDNGQIHVRNPTTLGQNVLHKYFRHSKYSSFQRQLNYFGFRKTQGKGKMSACTYTNVQLSGGNIKSLLNVKRKSSTGTGGKGEGEEGGEEDLSLLVEELEEGTDSDGGESSEGYTPVTVGQGLKRGAPVSFSASSALSMSSLSSGGSEGGLMARKRVRSSSSSSSCSLRGGGVVSLEESLAADEGLEGEEGGEEGSQGNTSAGALSGYSSSLSGQEEEEGEEEEDYGEDEDEDGHDAYHSFPPSQAAKHRQSHLHLHLPPHHHHQEQQQQQQQQQQLPLRQGGHRLSFTLAGGLRTSHACPNPSTSITLSSGSTTTTTATSSNSSSSSKSLKPLDVNALPTFSTDVLPAPSPRGADDFFPSYLTAFDPLGDSASSPWAWAEPPVNGSLSSLSLETGCGMTSLNSLDEGHSNHSAFARDEDKGGASGGREGGREREVLASMPSAAAIAAAALCSPRGESAFLLSVEGGGGATDFWGGGASSASS